MSGIDNQISNTRWGMFIKRIMSRIELGKLKYYKRNPLERKVFNLVSEIYKEEEGSLFLSFFTGRKPVLFSPGELMNIWEQASIMADHGGAFAEVGVFRGVSAKAICEVKGETPLHLFDTFEGLPDEVGGRDGRFKKGMFIASEKEVRARLSKYPAVQIYQFQQLYKARYGQDISVEEVRRRAENLMKLYRVTYTDHYPEPEICNKSKDPSSG